MFILLSALWNKRQPRRVHLFSLARKINRQLYVGMACSMRFHACHHMVIFKNFMLVSGMKNMESFGAILIKERIYVFDVWACIPMICIWVLHFQNVLLKWKLPLEFYYMYTPSQILNYLSESEGRKVSKWANTQQGCNIIITWQYVSRLYWIF